MLFNNNFCAIIEEDTAWVVRQDVPKTVFARIVDPLLNPNGLRMSSLSGLYLFAGTILTLCWWHKGNLADWLSSTHWSSWIVWARSFQLYNLVAATNCYLHLRKSLKIIAWTCLLTWSSQVCGTHSVRRHRFNCCNSLKVLSATHSCEYLILLGLGSSESCCWRLRDGYLSDRTFRGELLVWNNIVVRFDPSWQISCRLVVGNFLRHSLSLWKLANEIGWRGTR